MAAQPEGIKSFGSKLNVNFGKLRISQNEAARMFNLNRSSEQQLGRGSRSACVPAMGIAACGTTACSAGTNSPAQGLDSADLFRRCVAGCKRMAIRYVEDPECLDYHLFFCFYRWA